VIGSVHVSDVGLGRSLSLLRKGPKPGDVPGLRQADIALAAPLRSGGAPTLNIGRVGLVAFWDDDDALDRFLATHPTASALAGGWHVRLEALRAHGTWPGLPTDTPTSRHVGHHGAAVVLTLARLRLSQAPRFLRTSGKAEKRTIGAPGLMWATALARPPFVATCSLWEDSRSLSAYAYGSREPAHPDAIAADVAKPFHHQSAFIRFRPYAADGQLGGRNPLAGFKAALLPT
jgi:hypothetical protein